MMPRGGRRRRLNMSGWVKTEYSFPIHAGRFTVGYRNLETAMLRGIQEAAALRHRLMDCDPTAIEQAAMALITGEHPELSGGQLLWIKMRHFWQWEFVYLHPSLSVWDEASENGGVEAIPLLLPPGHRMVKGPDGKMMEWVDLPAEMADDKAREDATEHLKPSWKVN
jgi:hypothetical protein